MHLIAHAPSELVDDVRVVNILFLRRHRQSQVMAHQPSHQPGVERTQAVLTAKPLDVLRPQLVVIAATAFGDIVIQTGDVQQFRLGQPLHDGAAMRHFRDELRQEKAPQVAQEKAPQVAHHEQDVLIHRVSVEQVILHSANDVAEFRQISRQHAKGVHQPQLLGYPARLAQDLHKQTARPDIVAKLVVD